MSTTVIDRGDSYLVTLSEAKKHLRILHNREDEYITALIAVVTQIVEDLIDRTIVGKELRFSSLKNSCYYLGDYTIASIDSVKLYFENELVEDTDSYLLKGQILTISSTAIYDSVEIEFSVLTDFPIIPTAFKQAALILIGDLFNNRQEIVLGRNVSSTETVRRLLNPYTKYNLL